jgi:hypothetical protein
VFGAFGAAWSVFLIVKRGSVATGALLVRVTDVLSVLAYSLLVLVAIWEDLPDELGISHLREHGPGR